MNQWRSICIGHPVNVNFVLKKAILQGTVKVKEINAVNTEKNDRDRRCYFCGKPGHIKRFCFEYKRQNETQETRDLNAQVPRM